MSVLADKSAFHASDTERFNVWGTALVRNQTMSAVTSAIELCSRHRRYRTEE
jgi:hypothetical protein